MADPWGRTSAAQRIDAPTRKTIDIDAEKHASNPLSIVPRAIVCNVAGNVVVRFPGDSADRTLVLLAGVVYSYAVSHVRSATATGVIGLL